METDSLPTAEQKQPKLRWFHPTPGRLLIVLLAVEGVLLLSERFQWFPFNERKGWTVLIAIGSVGVAMVLMFVWWVFALLFRWRFQFSIRSLLVLVVIVAIPFSWLAVEMRWAREQREALKIMGGSVNYDYQWDSAGHAIDVTLQNALCVGQRTGVPVPKKNLHKLRVLIGIRSHFLPTQATTVQQGMVLRCLLRANRIVVEGAILVVVVAV